MNLAICLLHMDEDETEEDGSIIPLSIKDDSDDKDLLFDRNGSGNSNGRDVREVVESRFKFTRGNNKVDIDVDVDDSGIDVTVARAIIESQTLKASSTWFRKEIGSAIKNDDSVLWQRWRRKGELAQIARK